LKSSREDRVRSESSGRLRRRAPYTASDVNLSPNTEKSSVFESKQVRSESSGRLRRRAPSAASDVNQSPNTQKSSVFESKSIFDKGKEKLSSFHSRARSSSRKRSEQWSSFHEELVATSHNEYAMEVASDIDHSPKTEKNYAFESKSVRSESSGRLRRRAPSAASDVNQSPNAQKSSVFEIKHSPTTQKSSVFESKSIFDKGKEKLSSLHDRARSSSRKRSQQGSSFHEELVATSHNEYAMEVLASASSDHEVNLSSKTSKKRAVANKCKFDKKTGRCKKHPSVILAKKSSFSKGWDYIRDGCPLCAEIETKDEAGDEFNEISKKKMNALLGRTGSKVKAQSFDALSPSDNNNAGGEFRSTNNNRPSPRKMSNEIRKEDVKAFCRNSPVHNSQEIIDKIMTPQDDDASPARVSRMPYTTPCGKSGRYTGFVNNSGQPHGQGRMRYKNGTQSEGEWVNGYSEEYLENKNRMKKGFGTNVAKWKENDSSGRRSKPSSSKSSSVSQQQYPQGGQYSQADYEALRQQNALYHSSSHGMAQSYSQQPQVGMWNQSSGYQYPSSGGQSPHTGYYQGYRQT